MINNFERAWASVDEYLKHEEKIKEALKESLRYTWDEWTYYKAKLHIPGLYVLLNKANDKVYVGKACDIAKRIQSHQSSTLKEALNRNDFIVVRIIPHINDAELSWMERVLIKYYDLRYTSLNRKSLIYIKATDNLSQFKREDFDA